MDVILREKATVWRPRGKPRTEIPEQVFTALRATHRTGKVGVIPLDTDGALDTDGRILLSLLRIGATRLGKRLRTQTSDAGVSFEMVDRAKTVKKDKK